MPAEALFLFGTLRHPSLLRVVAGGDLPAEPAVLSDHRVVHARAPGGTQQKFPLCLAQSGATAQGLLIRPDAAARARLDAYERVFGYDVTQVSVHSGGGVVQAAVYLPEPGRWVGGEDWSLDDWAAHTGDLTTEAATEVMALLATGVEPAAIDRRYGMLEAYLTSRHRARAQPGDTTLRRGAQPGDVQIDAHRRPYTDFFAVEEHDLRFRRFDGTLSAPVSRAGFVAADAVTVLPYDPLRDTVMLIEQFRQGPHLRGDPFPWSLEAIAGRIDAHEEPEGAARREAREEARLSMGALHFVARYYASPGAMSEYLYSYVGIADLPNEAQGVGGMASEHEDIRAHVVAYDRLAGLVATGEIENAPLLISLQWLGLNRDRLRAG